MGLNDSLALINSLVLMPLGLVYIFILTEEWRFSKKIIKRATIIFISALLVLDCVIISIYGNAVIGKRIIMVVTLSLANPAVLFISKYRNGRALFICFSAVDFILVGTVLGEIIGENSTPQRMIARLVIYILIFCLIYRYFRNPFLEMIRQIDEGWYRMTLIPFSLSVLFLILIVKGDLYYDPYIQMIGTAVCFCACASYIVLFHVFCTLTEQYKMKSSYDLLQSQMGALQKQVEALRLNDGQMSMFRHDMKHFLQIQSVCLERGDLDGAKAILDSMDKNLKQVGQNVHVYTGSVLMDAMLSAYVLRAEKDEVDFTIHFELPEEQAAELVELAVVVSNGLENAFNACCLMPKGKKRVVRLNGMKEKGQYFLEIVNSFLGEVIFNKEHTMPVSNQPGHGYGSRSISAFARKYHAFVDYKVGDGWFSLRIIFKNE